MSYIYICVGDLRTRTHTRTYIMHCRPCAWGEPSDRQPEPPGREGDGLVSFKGHGGKCGLWENSVRDGAL